MRHGSHEDDRLQCTVITERGTRCTRVGTHSNGQGVLCSLHHAKLMAKRVLRAVPVVPKRG